ncbi:hypothetical protein DFJ73DRAFT_850438 [Zopfochytrium polystomum]|nr:hypothetical protein DFJ73DRAFT_850438 [Zopfochytrium polystomum]
MRHLSFSPLFNRVLRSLCKCALAFLYFFLFFFPCCTAVNPRLFFQTCELSKITPCVRVLLRLISNPLSYSVA